MDNWIARTLKESGIGIIFGYPHAGTPIIIVMFFLLFLIIPHADSQILLTVNDSNPNAVTITATGLKPAANNSAFTLDDGISLLDFFNVVLSGISGGVSGNLTANGASLAYDSIFLDNDSGSDRDLNLYRSSSNVQKFSVSSSAFTGVATVNLSSNAAHLPSLGSGGNVDTGDFGSGVFIGTWVVVPEPSTWILISVGLAVVLYGRKRTT